MATFEMECLRAHNILRARHGCPPLVLDQQLCVFAKQWASHLLENGTMLHRANNVYGENIYMSTGIKVNGTTVTQTWYNEERFHFYGSKYFNPRTGHFTQVIWRSAKKFGVGLAKRGNYTYVVANYDPAGNVQGCFETNVPRPIRI